MDELTRRYRPNTIDSVAAAQAALAAVREQRASIEARHARDNRACAGTFFTTRCVDAVHERRRTDLAKLRPIEVEANAFIRRDRVVERDRLLDEKRIKAEQEALSPRQAGMKAAKPPAPGVADTAPGPGNGGDRAGSRAGAAPLGLPPPQGKPRGTHVAKPITPPIDAATQARNSASFDRKAAESARRQQELAGKKAEKDKERAAKKAAAATASAASPAAAAPSVSPPAIMAPAAR